MTFLSHRATVLQTAPRVFHQEPEQKGFTVESTLDAIGQIIGQGSEEVKNEALKVTGVTGIFLSQDDIDRGALIRI